MRNKAFSHAKRTFSLEIGGSVSHWRCFSFWNMANWHFCVSFTGILVDGIAAANSQHIYASI
jgi:hypothetical protein